MSPTLANLGNDHGFISEEYIFIGRPKAKPREFMLKVDNIIQLWRSVIFNMVSESCSKLSHVNKILKSQTKNCELRRCSQQ